MRFLKQSTSVDLPIGPFLDETDGVTAETALTITQPDIRLKKNNGNWAQKNAAQTLTHEENGYYEVTLDATDTNTLGLLRVAVAESGALPVWEDFMIVPANIWDSWFGADLQQVDTREVTGTAQTAGDLAALITAVDNFVDTEIAAIITTLGTPAGASMSADIAAVKSDTAATLADTGTDGVVVAAGSKTGYALSAAGIQAIWDALTAALTTANSIGKLLVDNINATISSRSSQTSVDTIDDFLDTEIAAILEDTGTTLDDYVDDLESRLTAALATALQAHALGIGRGVVDAGSTTTAIVFKSVNGAAASGTNDFYNGRHIIFTSGALTLQATSISDYDGATKTATVPAVTGAPAEDVTFIIV